MTMVTGRSGKNKGTIVTFHHFTAMEVPLGQRLLQDCTLAERLFDIMG